MSSYNDYYGDPIWPDEFVDRDKDEFDGPYVLEDEERMTI